MCVCVPSMEYAAALINYEAALTLILKSFKLYFRRKKVTCENTVSMHISACMYTPGTVSGRSHRNWYWFCGELHSCWVGVRRRLASLSPYILRDFCILSMTYSKMIFLIKIFFPYSLCALEVEPLCSLVSEGVPRGAWLLGLLFRLLRGLPVDAPSQPHSRNRKCCCTAVC